MIKPKQHYAILCVLAIAGPGALASLNATPWLWGPATLMSVLVAGAFAAAIRRVQDSGQDMTMSSITAIAAEAAPVVAIASTGAVHPALLVACRFLFLLLQLAEIGRFHTEHDQP